MKKIVMNYAEFKDYLSKLVEREGSQSALAEKMGVAPQQLSRVALGKDMPSREFLRRIDMKREYVFTFTKEK